MRFAATLLVDFGLVVLVWLVQLVIYPSFRAVSEAAFREWHARYTFRVSFVVVPLMLAQVTLHGAALWEGASAGEVAAALGIAGAWGCTFFLSVPCHRMLGEEGKSAEVIERLIRTNWPRTLLWSLVFAMTLAERLMG